MMPEDQASTGATVGKSAEVSDAVSPPPLLQVSGLAVTFAGGVEALRGIDFTLDRGESLAIVGETGSGKSTLALCLAGLIQPPAVQGSVKLKGQELMGAPAETLRLLRWDTVALALQGAPFNPVVSVGAQVAEPLRERLGMPKDEARRRAGELAVEASMDPALLDRYPHELSGGEKRRAALAMVLALDPELVILDEPTAGLDPSTKQGLVKRLKELAALRNFGLIVISHDLTDATHLANRTIVLYAGEAMEDGVSGSVIGEPAHPYTWALVNAYPVMTTTKDFRSIRGLPPDPRQVPSGCAFHPRCTQAEEICVNEHPALAESRSRLVSCHFGGLNTLLSGRDLYKSFRAGKTTVNAVNGVSVMLREGESLGIIGPSGSGKTTLARLLTGHLPPDSGRVDLEDQELSTAWGKDARMLRRRIQLVMQDPWDALSPRMSVEDLVREPLDIAKQGDKSERHEAVAEALESVGLPSTGKFLNAFSHELSGGQLQRIALARALVAGPKLLVADEPTSMLDASEQARLLTVLKERQVEMGLGLILISHDMAVVRKVTDRIVVMDGGRVVEAGPSNLVSTNPASQTARNLIETAPAWAPSV